MAALVGTFVAAGGISVAAQATAPSSNQVTVQVRLGTASADWTMVRLTLPEAIASGSLHAVLNGKMSAPDSRRLRAGGCLQVGGALRAGWGTCRQERRLRYRARKLRANWSADALALTRAGNLPRHALAQNHSHDRRVVGGGTSDSAQSPREKGAKTILVNATCGAVTRSIPLVLNTSVRAGQPIYSPFHSHGTFLVSEFLPGLFLNKANDNVSKPDEDHQGFA